MGAKVILQKFTLKLKRRLDNHEFTRTVDAFSPTDASLQFDGQAFEVLSIIRDCIPTVKGKPQPEKWNYNKLIEE